MPRSALFLVRSGALALLLFSAAPALRAAAVNAVPSQMTFVQSPLLLPPAQTISVTATEGYLNISVSSSGASWLGYSVTGPTTPAIVTVRVYPAGLATGTYTGSVTIAAEGASNSPVVIPITMYVTEPLDGFLSTDRMSFYHTPGQLVPPPQNLAVNGPAGAFAVTATAETGAWLSVVQASIYAPSVLTVWVDPAGLSPGIYRGFITISPSVSPTYTRVVSVTLHVGDTGAIWANTTPLAFSYRTGGPLPARQSIQVSYYTLAVFHVRTVSSGWLHADPSAGLAPTTVSVWVEPAGLAPGIYTGSVVFGAPGAIAVTIVPVTLTVSGSPPLSLYPTSLTFEAIAGGPLPSPQSVSVSSAPSTNFNAQVALGNWLSVYPSFGTTPQVVTVSANQSGLTPGTYRGTIVISTPGSSSGGQLVNVSLTVTGGAPVTLSPTSLRFEASAPGETPLPQTLNASAPWPTAIAATVSGGWIQVAPVNATTPAALRVSVNTAGLAVGTHRGAITVVSPGSTVAPATAEVVLTIASPGPAIRAISNGAGMATQFAPGSLLTIYGKGLGPDNPQTPRLTAGQPVQCSLAGSRVLVNGLEAPLLYVHEDQINAVVPQLLAGQTRLTIRVDCHGMLSDPVTVGFDDTAPVLFTADRSGIGQGAIVNENGILNGSATPADRDSIVMLFGAGGGLSESPASGVIEIGPAPLRNPVWAWIGGWPAEVVYAGQAPGMISGMMQINLRVPREVPASPALPVIVRIGGAYSQSGVTLAVR